MMKDDDVKLLRGFADRQTDRRTNEQTFVIVESLSRLKISSFRLGVSKFLDRVSMFLVRVSQFLVRVTSILNMLDKF